MPSPYSMDLRRRVVAEVDRDAPPAEVARRFQGLPDDALECAEALGHHSQKKCSKRLNRSARMSLSDVAGGTSRVIGRTPQGHWKTTTFLAALRSTGLTAPLVLDGPMDGTCFLAYVRQFLVPTLEPGDPVVMENLSSHKQSGVVEEIRAVGADVLYLPPYSPDLNPIEKAFSKLKTLLRRSAERTMEGLWNRIGELLDEFTPSECMNYIRSCGYTAD